MSAIGGALLAILRLIGWLLLLIVAVLVLLLLTPVTAKLSYEGGALRVRVRILFVEFAAVGPDRPKKEKKTGKGGEADRDGPQEQSEPEKKRGGLDMRMVRAVLRPGGPALIRLLRALRLRHICVRVVVAGGDPCETGIAAGRTWQALGNAFALARQIWRRLRVDELRVIPDFMDEHEGESRFSVWVTALPVRVVALLLILAVRAAAYKIRQTGKDSAGTDNTR